MSASDCATGLLPERDNEMTVAGRVLDARVWVGARDERGQPEILL